MPLFWEQSFCIKSPIALGYTRGHFSALVPSEPYSRIDAARVDTEDLTFLPLMDCEHKLLPIHFLTQSEVNAKGKKHRQINIKLFSLIDQYFSRWVEKSL